MKKVRISHNSNSSALPPIAPNSGSRPHGGSMTTKANSRNPRSILSVKSGSLSQNSVTSRVIRRTPSAEIESSLSNNDISAVQEEPLELPPEQVEKILQEGEAASTQQQQVEQSSEQFELPSSSASKGKRRPSLFKTRDFGSKNYPPGIEKPPSETSANSKKPPSRTSSQTKINQKKQDKPKVSAEGQLPPVSQWKEFEKQRQEIQELFDAREQRQEKRRQEEAQAKKFQGLLCSLEEKKEKRDSYQNLMHTQSMLQDAISEAKAINVLLEQNKQRVKAAKMALDQKLLHKFIPEAILEKQKQEQEAIDHEGGWHQKDFTPESGQARKVIEGSLMRSAVKDQNRAYSAMGSGKSPGSIATQSDAQRLLLQKGRAGGRRNLNPLKRTNSHEEIAETTTYDAYSFYMLHVKEKPKPKISLPSTEVVKNVPTEMKNKTVNELGLMTKEQQYLQKMDDRRLARRTNLWGQRKHSGRTRPMDAAQSISPVTGPNQKFSTLQPKGEDADEEAPQTPEMIEIENKISEFLIQDELLDLQIKRAEDKERLYELKREQEERRRKVEEYKKKILEEAKAEEKRRKLRSRKAALLYKQATSKAAPVINTAALSSLEKRLKDRQVLAAKKVELQQLAQAKKEEEARLEEEMKNAGPKSILKPPRSYSKDGKDDKKKKGSFKKSSKEGVLPAIGSGNLKKRAPSTLNQQRRSSTKILQNILPTEKVKPKERVKFLIEGQLIPIVEEQEALGGGAVQRPDLVLSSPPPMPEHIFQQQQEQVREFRFRRKISEEKYFFSSEQQVAKQKLLASKELNLIGPTSIDVQPKSTVHFSTPERSKIQHLKQLPAAAAGNSLNEFKSHSILPTLKLRAQESSSRACLYKDLESEQSPLVTVRDLKGWAENSQSPHNLDLDEMIQQHLPNRHTDLGHHQVPRSQQQPVRNQNKRKYFQTEMKQMLMRNKPKLSMHKQAQSQILKMKASSLSRPSMQKIIKKVSLADL